MARLSQSGQTLTVRSEFRFPQLSQTYAVKSDFRMWSDFTMILLQSDKTLDSVIEELQYK